MSASDQDPQSVACADAPGREMPPDEAKLYGARWVEHLLEELYRDVQFGEERGPEQERRLYALSFELKRARRRHAMLLRHHEAARSDSEERTERSEAQDD